MRHLFRCGDSCLNRQCKIECAARTCPAGPKCDNQRFQQRTYKKLRALKTADRGVGAKALEVRLPSPRLSPRL